LPVAMQLIGKPWAEATLLRAAHAYEQSYPWRSQRPAIAQWAADIKPGVEFKKNAPSNPLIV
jgi:hypothetical protein